MHSEENRAVFNVACYRKIIDEIERSLLSSQPVLLTDLRKIQRPSLLHQISKIAGKFYHWLGIVSPRLLELFTYYNLVHMYVPLQRKHTLSTYLTFKPWALVLYNKMCPNQIHIIVSSFHNPNFYQYFLSLQFQEESFLI